MKYSQADKSKKAISPEQNPFHALHTPRNEFNIAAAKKLVFARAYVAAAGCAHIEVNGKIPLPDLRGVCPWPVYSESVRYLTHDVTDLVTPGRNALGMVAGNQTGRWTNEPQAIVLVVVKFAGEHTTPTFALSSSSAGWMGTEPYVTVSTAWDATIDWTKQEKGWSAPGKKARLFAPFYTKSDHFAKTG